MGGVDRFWNSLKSATSLRAWHRTIRIRHPRRRSASSPWWSRRSRSPAPWPINNSPTSSSSRASRTLRQCWAPSIRA